MASRSYSHPHLPVNTGSSVRGGLGINLSLLSRLRFIVNEIGMTLVHDTLVVLTGQARH